MFKALKAAPTSINFNEVYSALQTKVVDAQENPLAIIKTAKLYEVQTYCSLTNNMLDGFWFLGNKDAWYRLPTDIQTVARKRVEEGKSVSVLVVLGGTRIHKNTTYKHTISKH